MNPDYYALVFALLAGVSIAAACGLRAFLPLLGLGLAARFLHLELAPGARWLGSDPALVALGLATVLEIAADKIPPLDHALDLIGTFVRPAAATFATYGVLVHWPAPWAALLAVAGGTAALALHVFKAKLRLGSSAFTFGLANPWLSLAEDGLTLLLVVGALLVPAIAAALVLLLLRLARRGSKERTREQTPA